MDPPLRKTRGAWNEPGHAHFLTYSCFRRLPLLARDRSRQWVVDALRATRESHNVAIWAYVIMPEHVHLLLCPRCPTYEMRRILVAMKRPVSDAAREFLEQARDDFWLEKLSVEYPTRKVFRFWQPGGGFDHNVFRERTVAAIMEYIHANPVRRELVAHPTDWVWSSARFWEGWSNVPLVMDHPDDGLDPQRGSVS